MAETIRFAPAILEDHETLVKQFRPLAIFLESQLGVTIEFVYLDNYQKIIENLPLADQSCLSWAIYSR